MPRPDLGAPLSTHPATALEFLRTIERGGDPEEASVTREVTHRYLQARFGDHPLSAQEEAHLAARVKALGDPAQPPTTPS